MPAKIDATEFKERLAALCLQGRSWPRQPRDRYILLKSMILLREPQRIHTEKEVNARLVEWVNELDQILYIDHVTLRRYLVNDEFLSRDLAGRSYWVNTDEVGKLFKEEIDPVQAVEEARQRSEAEKRAYLAKREA